MKSIQQVTFPRKDALSTERQERMYVASALQLMWWRFRRHRLALISSAIIATFYVVALFAEFFAPYSPHEYRRDSPFAPPQIPHLALGSRPLIQLYVYGYTMEKDPKTFMNIYTPDTIQKLPISFLVRSSTYKLWGVFGTNIHFFGSQDPDARISLLGTDRLGRDMLSRVIYGSRISLSIGLVGVFLSSSLGILLGGISGYYGGVIDDIIQRIIEFLRCIPTIPLWMALSAAIPLEWPVTRRYFGITVILALIGWAGLARVVRSRFLSLREEDFVLAARLSGVSEIRIITRHMVPAFLSYIIASLTLSIPGMILGETSLSFLGLGLKPPAISWGVLLKEAQNFKTVALAPWLLLPGMGVVLVVLAFNFLGDGLRDAADPYAT